jgi:hypothetical protein
MAEDRYFEMKIAEFHCACGCAIHYNMDKTFGSHDPEPGCEVLRCPNCKQHFGWIQEEGGWRMLTPHEPFATRRSQGDPWKFYLWCPRCDRLTPYDIGSSGKALVGEKYSATWGECRKCGELKELYDNEITMIKACENTPVAELEEGFQPQLMQVVYQNPSSREVMELALRYHQMCDMFDKGVCSMLARDKTPMPANAEELRIINVNARDVLNAVLAEAMRKDLDCAEVTTLIKKGTEYLKQHIKAMPEEDDAP